MSNWNGTILGPPHVRQTHLHCGDFAESSSDRVSMKTAYTVSISTVVTTTQIHLPLSSSPPKSICLASTKGVERCGYLAGLGMTAYIHEIDPSKLPCLYQWKRDYTMETVLIELRRRVLHIQVGGRID